MKHTIKHSVLGLALLSSVGFTQSTNAQNNSTQKPNIIVFLVDDMGWQETSVPFHTEKTPLNERFHTPNMERLANNGMRFTQAYASAVCSPSRVSLITGTNPARHGVTCWTLFKGKSPERNHKTLKRADWNVNGLTTQQGVPHSFCWEQTLPNVLKQAGYYTMHIGKAHFGAIDTPGADPINIGFDLNIGGHAAGGPGSYHGDKDFSAKWRKGWPVWDVPGLGQYHGKAINLTEALTLEANKAIEQSVKNKKPFFLHMAHYGVHAPWEPDRRFVQKYLDAGLDTLLANHASMIESMDKSLGDIMQKLKELKIDQQTIILFISDNGAPSQMTRNRPLRGHKITPYEGGIRVPMIVKWPGESNCTGTTDQPVLIQDVYPTVIQWAGATQHMPNIEDNQSIVPIIRHKTQKTRSLIWHYPNFYDVEPFSVIRKKDWKLIYRYNDNHFELYNLKNDISERNDLAKREPKRVKKLAKELTQYLKRVKAHRPFKGTNPASWPDETIKQ
ncbi:DUF4976 domain-containing protein [Prolixibacteraceae bacterium JC049]|nr:DUF4976 domain-containing protein [Prolixibacteraceae bacterium JC049]